MLYYLNSVVSSFSQFLNSILGGNKDQTFSARCGEGRLHGVKWCRIMVYVIDTIFFWQLFHCYASYLSDAEFTYGEQYDLPFD